MITGAAVPAAEAAGVRAAPARVRAGPEGVAVDRQILLAAGLAWTSPALRNLPLVGVPPDRYGDRYATVPRHTVPRPRLADRRSATPPAERR